MDLLEKCLWVFITNQPLRWMQGLPRIKVMYTAMQHTWETKGAESIKFWGHPFGFGDTLTLMWSVSVSECVNEWVIGQVNVYSFEVQVFNVKQESVLHHGYEVKLESGGEHSSTVAKKGSRHSNHNQPRQHWKWRMENGEWRMNW